MRGLISDRVPPIALRNLGDPWWANTKVTDDFLDPLFEAYFQRLSLPNLMRKRDYHQLASLQPATSIDKEVSEVLDAIVAVASQANAL